ncbi:MAG: SdpI family protein [Nanoarchaeota archaeon]|nr:SdpI family protein [Nanoarchaeota archaeon]
MSKKILSIFIIITIFLISILVYPYLPEKIITHWNSQGIADGYMTRPYGLFLLPIISIILFFLFIILEKIDPLIKKNKSFSKTYSSIILALVLFLFYIHLLSILLNLGYRFNMLLMLIPVFSLMYFYIGVILRTIKRNWFIGIRTPWTLSSDKVWEKTHKLGSKLFIISGIITFFGIFFIKYSIWFILLPIIISAIILVVYSYLEFKKIKR